MRFFIHLLKSYLLRLSAVQFRFYKCELKDRFFGYLTTVFSYLGVKTIGELDEIVKDIGDDQGEKRRILQYIPFVFMKRRACWTVGMS
ncbi:MAG: hypothetical protein P4L49_04230 [Desulfosporosinus sp.]|nr:hypothetical protein [Desulfosporosinus sp.]